MNAELFALNKSSSKRRKHDYPGKSLFGIYPVCLKILNYLHKSLVTHIRFLKKGYAFL